jgi:hypothetical protein
VHYIQFVQFYWAIVRGRKRAEQAHGAAQDYAKPVLNEVDQAQTAARFCLNRKGAKKSRA